MFVLYLIDIVVDVNYWDFGRSCLWIGCLNWVMSQTSSVSEKFRWIVDGKFYFFLYLLWIRIVTCFLRVCRWCLGELCWNFANVNSCCGIALFVCLIMRRGRWVLMNVWVHKLYDHDYEIVSKRSAQQNGEIHWFYKVI